MTKSLETVEIISLVMLTLIFLVFFIGVFITRPKKSKKTRFIKGNVRMKVKDLTIEQYDKWCDSKQGLEFNEELKNIIYKANTPLEMYNVIIKAKEMFEREVVVLKNE